MIDLGTKKLQKISDSFSTQEFFCLQKDSPISIFDIQKKQISWKAKNLPNDELDLQVPIWDIDVGQSKKNENLFYVSTSYGEVKIK